MQMICFECGAALTNEERHYYAGNCEECERDYHDRIAAWRAGGEDPELSRIYSGLKEGQEPLGSEFERVWDENSEKLYQS